MMTKKYRKKPVVVEAWSVKELSDMFWSSMSLPFVITESTHKHQIFFKVNGEVQIETLEGTMIGKPEDMLIRGVNGEFYPCKPDIFEQTYEEIEE